jgi:hypothetical protein
MILEHFRKKWEDNGLIILVIISIVFLCIYAVLRIGQQGTYSENAHEPLWINYNISKKQRPKQQRQDSAGEIICREYLQRRFNKPFNKIRPDFLKNPVTGGYNLELDCYNADLRLAVEYNGVQHYKYTPYFHRNKDAFTNQKYRDEMKRERCKTHGIHLIEVPYTIPKEKIEKFLEAEILRVGF